MRRRTEWIFLAVVSVVLAFASGCRPDAEEFGGDDGSGQQDGDTGGDADALPDADGVTDDGGFDGESEVPADGDATGDVDGEVPESCPCLALPETCEPPPADEPAFTPADDSALRQLLALVACAETSIRAAIYETTWDCIVDALLARLAADSDLTIDLVIDDDQCPRGAGDVLTCPLARIEDDPRVAIVDDSRSGLMHHKFAIVDGARVWVSSGNFSKWSFCTDYNNSLIVDQAEIVGAYQAVFDRMFTAGTFGPTAPAPAVVGGAYSVYFGPETPIDSPPLWFNEILSAVAAATTSVEVMVNAWTRMEIADALIAAGGRGVTVRALVAHTYVDDPPAQALIAAGIPVRGTTMHSKVMILDGAVVVTGSANWSANAWSNNENSLWIADPAIAAAYQAEFERAFTLAAP